MRKQLQQLKEVIYFIESVNCDDGNKKLGKAHYHIEEAYELLEEFAEPLNKGNANVCTCNARYGEYNSDMKYMCRGCGKEIVPGQH